MNSENMSVTTNSVKTLHVMPVGGGGIISNKDI